MSDAKNELLPRSLEEINTEYTQTCAQIGDLQFKIEVLKSEIQKLYGRISQLKIENGQRMELENNASAPEPTAIAK